MLGDSDSQSLAGRFLFCLCPSISMRRRRRKRKKKKREGRRKMARRGMYIIKEEEVK